MKITRAISGPLGTLIVGLTAASASSAQGDEARARPLPSRAHQEFVGDEVLVKFRRSVPQGQVLAAERSVGAAQIGSFETLGIRHWRLGRGTTVAQALEILRGPEHASFIEYAEPNYLWRAADLPDDPRLGELWGLHNAGQTGGSADSDIDAPEAWEVETGSAAVVVGVIDSGVDYLHEDLAANVFVNPGEIADNGIDDDGNGYVDDVRGWDFVGEDNDPMDDFGHGTHASGTIGAVGGNGLGVVGVSPNVRILPLKFLDAGGTGSTNDAIAAILYAAALRDSQGNPLVRITSNSWGGGQRSRALEEAIASSGSLFVAAAGNAGSGRKMYPAAYGLDNIVSVAASDHDDALASFSSYGSDWVDLAAPGVDILSTEPGDSYGTRSGTSMACPHVAGVAALLRAHFPADDDAMTRSRLLDSVDPVGALAGSVATGGRLNAARALGIEPADPGVDTIAPAPVLDLAVDGATITHASLELHWTATGDDGDEGAAWVHDLRFLAGTPITEANWDSATEAQGEPQPSAAGNPESFTLTGLAGATTYYVALTVLDEAGNASMLSNVVSATTAIPPMGAWQVETVDAEGDVGFYNSLAFDSAGRPGLGYSHEGSGQTKVALWNGVDWDIEVVDSGAGGVDFEFAPDGSPSLAYGGNKLKYARRVGGSWQIDTIERRGVSAEFASLQYDPVSGEPMISYQSTGAKDSALMLARRTGAGWLTEVVDDGAGARYTSLACDPSSGHPIIAYSDDVDGDNFIDSVRVARWNGAQWQVELVETGVLGYGVFVSLAIDPSTGHPALAHRGSSTVRFVRWSGSSWDAEVVGIGTGCSLAFDAAGTPYVGLVLQSDASTRVASPDGIDWQLELVDTAAEFRTSIALDPSGRPAVVYSDQVEDDLKFARK